VPGGNGEERREDHPAVPQIDVNIVKLVGEIIDESYQCPASDIIMVGEMRDCETDLIEVLIICMR
jgi:type II secretory ATPase GspE/PulE/Tfp pilus assembly ATPase PilB-like protein